MIILLAFSNHSSLEALTLIASERNCVFEKKYQCDQLLATSAVVDANISEVKSNIQPPV